MNTLQDQLPCQAMSQDNPMNSCLEPRWSSGIPGHHGNGAPDGSGHLVSGRKSS